MRRSLSSLVRPLAGTIGFGTNAEKLVASVLFERLPVVIPKIDPVVYAFREFSFRWQQQYRRRYPDEFLDMSKSKAKGDYHIDYKPAPRITEADKTNDRKTFTVLAVADCKLYNVMVVREMKFLFTVVRSLQRALDRRVYLLIYGTSYMAPDGKPVWHFPEKLYNSEETLRKCAESALQSVLGDLSHTYFVGNAPMGHVVIQPDKDATAEPFKQFFFKSQVIATNKFNIKKCEDFVWVTKDELLEFFPEQAEFLNKMIIS